MNFSSIFELLNRIGPMLITVSWYLAPFVEFLKDIGTKLPDLTEYLYQGVLAIFDWKDEAIKAGEDPLVIEAGIKQKREELVVSGLATTHGSGPQATEQVVRGSIEALVAIVKADRYGYEEVLAKEDKARALGYLVSPDLDRAYEAYPKLFGQKR